MHPTVATLLLALAVASLPVSALAQEPVNRRITVVGEGTANLVPDLAVIQTGVTTQGKTAREASEANSTIMAKVLAALKDSGIVERDMQTVNLSIRPVYEQRRDGDNRITGFQASNQVRVRVRPIARLASVLDQMIAAGANEMSGIHFAVSERTRLLDSARTDAVADAKRKAELFARAANVRLGRAVAIVEEGNPPVPMERLAMRAAPGASVPVAVGEQTVQIHVTVTFELLQ